MTAFQQFQHSEFDTPKQVSRITALHDAGTVTPPFLVTERPALRINRNVAVSLWPALVCAAKCAKTVDACLCRTLFNAPTDVTASLQQYIRKARHCRHSNNSYDPQSFPPPPLVHTDNFRIIRGNVLLPRPIRSSS